MNISNTNNVNQAFDNNKLHYWKRKVLKRRILKISLSLIFFLVIIGFFVDYLSNLPRERHARKATYIQKVQLGAKQLWTTAILTLTTEHENPKTKLPIVEIYIRGDRIDKLNSALPDSGRLEQKADVKIENQNYRANVRYRGDSMNHWAFPNKSWIILEKDLMHNEMQVINLTVPRVESQISNWLGYEIARGFGDILVPQADLVHFRLNRNFDGIRMMLEQPNIDFLNRRNLPLGKIIDGDIDSSQIYGGVPRKRLYQDESAWKIISATEDGSNSEISSLIRIIKHEHNPYKFYYRMNQALDIKAIIKYIAMLEMVGSVHIDETHNGKYYFNPISGKISPIAWDTVAYFWKNNKELDLAPNSLFRVLLANPEYRELKDKYLWQAINNEMSEKNLHSLIDYQTSILKDDVLAFPLKLHANDKGIRHLSNRDWQNAIQDLKNVIKERHNLIKTTLKKNNTRFNIIKSETNNRYYLAVEVASASGATLEKIDISLADNNEAKKLEVIRLGLEDIEIPFNPIRFVRRVNVRKNKAVFKLNDPLYSKRRMEPRKKPVLVPAKYLYELKFDQDPKQILDFKIILKNSITKESFNAAFDKTLDVPNQYKPLSVWWSPDFFADNRTVTWEGDVVVNDDLEINKYDTLVIKEGANIKLAKGVSVLINGGKLIAQGSVENPVTFSALNENERWGVLAGINNAKINLKYVNFKGGTNKNYNFVKFEEPLSIHYSELKVENCIFNFAISLKYSDGQITNSEFFSYFKNPIVSNSSTLSLSNNKYNILTPKLSTKIAAKTTSIHESVVRNFEFSTKIKNQKFKEFDRDNYLNVFKDKLQTILADNIDLGLFKSLVSQIEIGKKNTGGFYREIYFDTPDNFHYLNNSFYSLRSYNLSFSEYNKHLKNYTRYIFLPKDFQVISNFIIENNDDEIKSYSLKNQNISSSMNPPIKLKHLISIAKTGYLNDSLLETTKHFINYYKYIASSDDELYLEPSLVSLNDIVQFTISAKTPWSSSEQTKPIFEISLDYYSAYNSETYMQFLEARENGDQKLKKPDSDSDLFLFSIKISDELVKSLEIDLAKAKEEKNILKIDELQKLLTNLKEDAKKLFTISQNYLNEEGIENQTFNKSIYEYFLDNQESY